LGYVCSDQKLAATDGCPKQAAALFSEVVKLSAFESWLRKVKLLELLENSAQWFGQDHLHESHGLHLLIELPFLFIRLFLRLFRCTLRNGPSLLLDQSEVYFYALHLFAFLMPEFVGDLCRLFDILKHLLYFLVELFAELASVACDEFGLPSVIASVDLDEAFGQEQGVHHVECVSRVQ
jgi:hypothetical protein